VAKSRQKSAKARVATTATPPGGAAAAPRDRWAIALVGAALLALFGLGGHTQAEAADVGAAVLATAGAIAAISVIVARAAQVSRLALAWCAFAAWALVSAFASGRVWASLAGESTDMVGWFAIVAMLAIALAVAVRSDAVRRVLATVAPWALAVELGFAAVQLVTSFGSADVGAAVRGTLPNSTYFGEAVLLLLPWTLVSARGRLRMSAPVRVGLAAASVVILAASGSRVAAVLSLVWAGFAVWRSGREAKRSTAFRIGTVAAMVATALAAGLAFAGTELLDITHVLGERPQMWRQAVLAVAERPLTGFGPDGFLAGGVSVGTPDAVRAGAAPLLFGPGSTDPHNLLMWVAVSTGIVGLALFAWGVVELLLRIRSSRGLLGESEGAKAAAWGAALLAVLLLTAPGAVQVLPLFALVLGGSAGVGAAGAAAPEGTHARARTLARAGTLAVLGVALVACVSSLGNAVTRLPLESASETRSPGIARSAQAASDFWRADAHLAYLASVHWGWAVRANPRLAAGRPDLAAIARAVKLDRRDPFIALEYARTLGFYAEPPASVERAYREAIRRWPLFPLAHAEYALVLAHDQKNAQAAEQIDLALLGGGSDPARDAAVMQAKTLLGE
jgi:hypothetical protein